MHAVPRYIAEVRMQCTNGMHYYSGARHDDWYRLLVFSDAVQ